MGIDTAKNRGERGLVWAKTTAFIAKGRSFFCENGAESEKIYQKVRLIQIKAVFLHSQTPEQNCAKLPKENKTNSRTES